MNTKNTVLGKQNRIGRFELSGDLVRGLDLKDLSEILMGFFILKAKYDILEDKFCYVALCSLFDEIKLGAKVPLYEIVMHRTAVGARAIRAEKINV